MPAQKKPSRLVFSYWEKLLYESRYYQNKLSPPKKGILPWLQEQFFNLPFTTKKDLQDDQAAHPPYGQFHYLPSSQYCRLHQTSGSTGAPLSILDTSKSWSWMLKNWLYIFKTCGIKSGDRLFFPFSFGPFLGFWTAFEAANQAGLFTLSGGGISSEARIDFLLRHGITVLLCTPSYALRLGEVAENNGADLGKSKVRKIILAGEPGASIPSTRKRIEKYWGNKVVDHHGLTETGPVSVECPKNPMVLHLVPKAFFPEIIDPQTGQNLGLNGQGELVLTSLGRTGSAVFRYKTGDLVLGESGPCNCGYNGLSLKGGILGRADEMVIIKGNNFFPSVLQGFLHEFSGIAEYKATFHAGIAQKLILEVEVLPGTNADLLMKSIGIKFKEQFLFSVEVQVAPTGSLPRADHKAKRFQVLSKIGG